MYLIQHATLKRPTPLLETVKWNIQNIAIIYEAKPSLAKNFNGRKQNLQP